MHPELREELIKLMHDTPAYGAIILTKLSNPDVTVFSDFEGWVYAHGWFWLLMYRFGVIIYDIDKKLSAPVIDLIDGKVKHVSGYQKILMEFKKLLK
jgi:hypothetical protein